MLYSQVLIINFLATWHPPTCKEKTSTMHHSDIHSSSWRTVRMGLERVRRAILLSSSSYSSDLFNPFTARVDDGVCEVVLTFTSVDKILWCDHSNEISLEALHVLLFVLKNFTKWNLGFLSNLPLVIFGSERVNSISTNKIFEAKQKKKKWAN